MRRNMKRKAPVVSIVVGILFVAMLGTTIYSVGELQKVKYKEPVPVQVVEKIVEVEKTVEVEKDCPVPDDSLRQEYIRTLIERNGKITKYAELVHAYANIFDSVGQQYRSRGEYALSSDVVDMANGARQVAGLLIKDASLMKTRATQLRGY